MLRHGSVNFYTQQIDICMNPSSNLLRNSYGYQMADPPTLRSPTTLLFPAQMPPQQDSIRQFQSKLQGVESLVRKKYNQTDNTLKGLPNEQPLTEQYLRGSRQTNFRKIDYPTLRNTTHFNPINKFQSGHNELRRSPGAEDPHRTANRALAQQPANNFLRPNEKKLLQNKHSFLANHHQNKTPSKQIAEKVTEEKSNPYSPSPSKYKTLFDSSAKTCVTLKGQKADEEKKLFKGLNEMAEIQQKQKLFGEAARSPNKKSKILNGFQLGSSLGKGKFGEVFLVRHHQSGFFAALKRTEKKKVKQFKMAQQFVKEVKLHSSLDHPNIVKFYGVFEQAEEVYLVLQYLNGGTLFDYLNEVTAIPFKEAVQYLRDIIQALTYMHDRSIAHRDIKPQNIVISSQGVAKLCDFGWSALVQTSRRTYCGTFDYAPPEILQRKNYDMSVDIWCVGVLTYELLTGRVPFQGKKRNVVMEKIVNVDRNSFEYPPQVPPEAREFIEALVQKDPALRPKCHDLLKFRMFTQNLTKGVKTKKLI